MAAHDMFLAMMLANAKREEASGIVLTVDNQASRIDMLLLDGSSKPLTPPPAEVLLKIIQILEGGQTQFRSAVFEATIEAVNVKRGPSGMAATISSWTIEHT
jgi:hypothetical protein